MSEGDWYERAAAEWPPRDLAYRAAVRQGVELLGKGNPGHAYRAFQRAAGHAGDADERELARGLVHAAACLYKARHGDRAGAARQRAHAGRRLAPYRDRSEPVDVGSVLAAVERGLG